MRVPALLLVTSAIVLGSGSALAQEWIKFVDADERFIVNFPSQPMVEAISYESEYGATLSARVYAAADRSNSYSVTVVDYRDSERLLRERYQDSDEPYGGDLLTSDVRGSIAYAATAFRRRGGEVTYDAWAAVDRIAGHQLQITNPDQTRTFVGIYLHASRLYILEATAPANRPAPGHFQQSLGILDGEGKRIRYAVDTDGNRTRVDTSYEWIGSDEP